MQPNVNATQYRNPQDGRDAYIARSTILPSQFAATLNR